MVAISLYFGRLPSAFQGAGVAQLVEHHLAKVTVVSSSLITRSIFLFSLGFFNTAFVCPHLIATILEKIG